MRQNLPGAHGALSRIAQQPKRKSIMTQAANGRIVSTILKRKLPVLRLTVKGNSLFDVAAARGKLALIHECRPLGVMCLKLEVSIILALSKAKHFIRVSRGFIQGFRRPPKAPICGKVSW